MQQFPTRTSSNTPLLIAALGVSALAAYALSSPRRRAAVVSASRSALDTGSRVATTSAERLQNLVPEAARDSVSRYAARARSASDSVTSATAVKLHDALDRATELMHEVVARARRQSADAVGGSRESSRDDVPEPIDDIVEDGTAGRSPARGVMIAAAAFGAGLYAMQRYGASERVRHKLGADDSGTVRLERTLFVDAPIEQVFDAWASPGNFPRFMSRVENVRPGEGDRSRWRVRGPAGVGVEFDAVMRRQRPNEMAWESEPGSTVHDEGRILLVPEGSGTRVTVRVAHRPPSGAWGRAVSSFLGANPKQEFEDDLNRMKQFIEDRRPKAPQSA
jgi:uncharacterized membrane protein